tara:strand:+ start:164 stop:415 length:252 start_codon:yes stop_codon:yes gene_type:complete
MRKINEIRTEELTGNYRRIFTSDDGQVVLEHLKLCHNFYRTSQVKGDPHESAFQEGQRYVVLNILTMLEDKQKVQPIKGNANE